jgi:hypothetical protein
LYDGQVQHGIWKKFCISHKFTILEIKNIPLILRKDNLVSSIYKELYNLRKSIQIEIHCKSSVTFLPSDLGGTWYAYTLTSGGSEGSEGWEIIDVTINGTNGYFTISGEDSGGNSISGTGLGPLSISGSGIITESGNTTAHGAMSSDKNIAVITDTGDSGEAVLRVLVKSGDPFSQPDLKGKWYGHTLTSGNYEAWIVSDGTFNSTGAYNASYTDSRGGSGTDSGILNIGTNGKITVTGSSTAHGAMSSDKNIIVITETPGTGVYSLMILVKGVPIYNPALPLLLLDE